MKIKKDELMITEGINREWIITNGIGGYAAGTVVGINTRKYHGLLVAPLTPPARRFLILSKLDESLEISGEKFNLYSNMCHNYISNGFKYQESFEKDIIPIFTYQVKDITIKKYICMEYGKNTVCVLYNIHNSGEEAKLTITPIINFRDFHTMNINYEYNLRQEEHNNKLKVVVNDNSSTPFYMYVSNGKYIKHENDVFRNMFYIEEEKRGFFPEENLAVPRKIQNRNSSKIRKGNKFCMFIRRKHRRNKRKKDNEQRKNEN